MSSSNNASNNTSFKKKSSIAGNTKLPQSFNQVHQYANDISKISSASSNKNSSVSNLVSPSRKFMHKKNQSSAFNFSDKIDKTQTVKGPKMYQNMPVQ